MSNTVITNYTDLNGPSTKADSSVVVIVNKDGSLSVDQNLLGTLMGTDGSQSAGISVVRVGHEGRPDDATDSESEDDKIPHVTLTVDSYYNEPNSIIKYDSGAEMLQSLRIETRENSLLGFQNDHCYTPLKSPAHDDPQQADNFSSYDESVIEIMHAPPPKPVPSSKKITILEQQIIPKGKKLLLKPAEPPVIVKGDDVLNKPISISKKPKDVKDLAGDGSQKSDENTESSSISSSGDSIPDRDSDSDYKDTKDRPGSLRLKKNKMKPRILKSVPARGNKLEPKLISRLKPAKNIIRKDIKDKVHKTVVHENKDIEVDLESLLPSSKISTAVSPAPDLNTKSLLKQNPKIIKKEKKTPAHVHSALLSDMTSLFSTPDVIRRVSTDNKPPAKNEKESTDKKLEVDTTDKKIVIIPKMFMKPKDKTGSPTDKTKPYDPMPHIDDASLAQILQDTTGITNPVKSQQAVVTTSNALSSPGLAGPLSPTLDLLGGLQPEEEGLTEDFLMSVAQLVATSENLQEVIDKQVLGKVDSTPVKTVQTSPIQVQTPNLYEQTLTKSAQKTIPVKKENPIEIVRRDGRVITLPPIEAPATRASKRKSQIEGTSTSEVVPQIATPPVPVSTTPEPQVQAVSKQYTNKKINLKKQEQILQTAAIDKVLAESQDSWNSEDDPFRLWCICKQPHNNRFMICCDGCEDWFHGKCVNITKAMGQQMEAQGIEWRCPNCIKKAKTSPRIITKVMSTQSRIETDPVPKELKSPPGQMAMKDSSKTSCIVCKKPARVSSIYCSNNCIWKHAQDSLGNQGSPTKGDEPGTSSDKPKAESRVIVYERKSGRLLAGPNAPTAENLKSWLQSNPTFEVVRPGTLSTIKPSITKKKPFAEPGKIQTTLNFDRIPKKTDLPKKTENVTPKKPDNAMPKKPEPVTISKKPEPVIISKKPENVTPKRTEIVTPKRSDNLAMRKSENLTPRRSIENVTPVRTPVSQPERMTKLIPLPREETKAPQLKSPVGTKLVQSLLTDTPKASTSTARPVTEPRKLVRATSSRSQSLHDKAPAVSPSTSRRKDSVENKNTNKMSNGDYEIRENVRKALQEQINIRMAEPETTGVKFTDDEIEEYANDTENELHELFRDVGMKYKAKYRSLMFNIKDRKNLSLWQKICDRELTPKQLVRLSPEELASQELAQWRDKESKHQLELIKKSELDLLAASKTYVLKTHKGEEVMENKESVSTELDPELVPVEDVVTALNDETIGPDVLKQEDKAKKDAEKKKHSKKRGRDEISSSHSKRSRRESKRDSDRKSRSSRRRSEVKDREERRRSTRKSEKKSNRTRSSSRDRSKRESKEKSEPRDRRRSSSRRRSSREFSRSKSQGRERSRSRRRDQSPDRRDQSRDRRDQSRDRRAHSRDRRDSRARSRSMRRASAEQKPMVRSRSQDAVANPIVIDSTDPDLIERPKSAMQKETHPEYDPHEPMITSALSEEDLRKTGDDTYGDSYTADIGTFDSEYVPSKISLDTSEIVSSPTYNTKQDKTSEAESDQEPSSTVESSAATVWSGCVNMVDVARFYVAAYEASGSPSDLEDDLSTELDIVGRINPETVWDYIAKMKKTSNKDIVILRLQTANDEEKMQYIALYSYLSSRNRLGVVKTSHMMTVKDLYVVPLSATAALPAVLRPLDGPGLGDVRTHLLIAIVIRKKRLPLPLNLPEPIPAKVSRESRKRSYTPPASPRRRTLPTPAYTTPVLSTSVKDKIAASLVSADEEEAYSPGSAPSGARADSLRDKMDELNRQIEEQKLQIRKMAQADSSVAEDNEAYSPSRPLTPPEAATSSVPTVTTVGGVANVGGIGGAGGVPLADIALPSNLHEILATIKQRSETAGTSASNDVDMRNNMPPS